MKFPTGLHIQILTATRGFRATARLLLMWHSELPIEKKQLRSEKFNWEIVTPNEIDLTFRVPSYMWSKVFTFIKASKNCDCSCQKRLLINLTICPMLCYTAIAISHT